MSWLYSFSSLSLSLWFQSISFKFFVYTILLFSYYVFDCYHLFNPIERWQSGLASTRKQASKPTVAAYEIINYTYDQHFMICTLIFVCWCNRQFDFFSHFLIFIESKTRWTAQQHINRKIEEEKIPPSSTPMWIGFTIIHNETDLASTKAIKYELCHPNHTSISTSMYIQYT